MDDVQRATIGDRADVVDSVTAAFHDDPTMRWLFPDDFDRQVAHFFGYLFDRRVDDAEVWTAPGVGASLWEPPGGPAVGSDVAYGRVAAQLSPDALQRLDHYHHIMEGRLPTEGAWYLGVLGVRPTAQARGVGRRLFDAVRQRADAMQQPIVLETAVPGNVGLYGHWGFELIEHFTVPDGGPPVWVMRRPPGAGAW